MDVQVTVTLTGSPDEIKLALGSLERVRATEIADEKVASSPDTSGQEKARRFTLSLTALGKLFVSSVLKASNSGKFTWRDELSRMLSTSGTLLTDEQINGVIGTVGMRWRQTFGTDNPFTARVDSGSRRQFYRIDEPSVRELLTRALVMKWRTPGELVEEREQEVQEALMGGDRLYTQSMLEEHEKRAYVKGVEQTLVNLLSLRAEGLPVEQIYGQLGDHLMRDQREWANDGNVDDPPRIGDRSPEDRGNFRRRRHGIEQQNGDAIY